MVCPSMGDQRRHCKHYQFITHHKSSKHQSFQVDILTQIETGNNANNEQR